MLINPWYDNEHTWFRGEGIATGLIKTKAPALEDRDAHLVVTGCVGWNFRALSGRLPAGLGGLMGDV